MREPATDSNASFLLYWLKHHPGTLLMITVCLLVVAYGVIEGLTTIL